MHPTTRELDETRDRLAATASPEQANASSRALNWLIASGIRKSVLKPGDLVEPFTLPDIHGQTIDFCSLLEKGPVVISFYRGGWCPYCTIELRGLQRVLREIMALGATLIAISPQTIEFSLATERENHLTFPLLSDSGNKVARQFGIVFDLPASFTELHAAIGLDLTIANGPAGAGSLPVPVTFIVDSERIVRFAFFEEDWSKRLDPEVILDTLRSFWEVD